MHISCIVNSRLGSFSEPSVVPLLQFFFVCGLVVPYVAFVLSFYVPHLSFFSCLDKAVLSDCTIYSKTCYSGNLY